MSLSDADRQRHLDRAARFEVLKQTEPDDIVVRFGLATERYALGEFAAAAVEAREAIRIEHDYSAAYLLLGRSLYAAREIDEAVQVLTEGYTLAERVGDLMPAREMRAVLRRISAERAGESPAE